MRKSFASLAAIVALAVSSPVLGQDDAGTIDFEVAMDCGVASAFLGGVVEADDPGFSSELIQSAEVWMLMAYDRFSGSEAEYDARIDARTDELTAEITAMADEDEITDFFTTVLGSCEIIRAANSAEYDQAAATMAAEG
jgi:hypothetical protein